MVVDRILSIIGLRRKALPALQTVSSRGSGWFRWVSEPFSGAWQRNVGASPQDILTFAAVYACVTLKATDIAKLRPKLMEVDKDGIWSEVIAPNPAYSPLFRSPNHYQTWIQFIEQWMVSKFVHGNAYVVLQRNNRGGLERGNVEAMYVLDPTRVRVLVGPTGDVYYALSVDPLSRQTEDVVVPAREMIHDPMTPLYHSLCGISPLSACALAALQGLRVQENSESFFGNGSMPSGIVEMPDEIDETQQRAIEQSWKDGFSGNNSGRVAVLSAGIKFTPLSMRAVDAQLIDQLRWTSENVCTAHHVPPFKVGVGPMPSHNNIEALNQQYYSEALQCNIECAEWKLDIALGLPLHLGIEFDLNGLFRADSIGRATAAEKAIKSGMSINEARRRFYDLGPVTGGETPYLQEQNWPLNLLASREVPVAAPTSPVGPAAPNPAPSEESVDKAMLMKAYRARLSQREAA